MSEEFRTKVPEMLCCLWYTCIYSNLNLMSEEFRTNVPAMLCCLWYISSKLMLKEFRTVVLAISCLWYISCVLVSKEFRTVVLAMLTWLFWTSNLSSVKALLLRTIFVLGLDLVSYFEESSVEIYDLSGWKGQTGLSDIM